jgi:DNA-binding MarR family transcriptional regulator
VLEEASGVLNTDRAEHLAYCLYQSISCSGLGLTQQDLADALFVTKGNMTYHLCRMEGRGLVDRRPEGRRGRG